MGRLLLEPGAGIRAFGASVSRPAGYAAPGIELPEGTVPPREILLGRIRLARAGDAGAQELVLATLAAVLEASAGHRRVALDALGISRHVFFTLLREPWAQGIVSQWPAETGGALHEARIAEQKRLAKNDAAKARRAAAKAKTQAQAGQ